MGNSSLRSLLTVLAVVVTALAVLFTITGTWLFLQYLIVSAVALAGWLYFSFKETSSIQRLVSPYILSIVVLLILNTCRNSSDFYLFIGCHYHSLFSHDFSLNYTNWFVFFVCLPVSLLLLGGFFLFKYSAVRFYFYGAVLFIVYPKLLSNLKSNWEVLNFINTLIF